MFCENLKYRLSGVFKFVAAMLAVLLQSCADEAIRSVDGVEEGRAATVSLKWDLETVEHKSRTASDVFFSGTVNTIWIGVYDYTTGDVVYSKIFEVGGMYNEPDSRKIKLSLSSGRRRIVAVANPNTNFGVSDNDELNKALGKDAALSLTRLSDLLLSADTWEKYKSISASLTRSSDVSPVGSDMVMTGVYYESGHPASSWLDANEGYVDIKPGVNELAGKIHLRRLFSLVRFNIIAGDGIEIEPLSWQVMNVPGLSYLHEQQGNSSDVCGYFATAESPAPGRNYSNSTRSFIFESGKLEYADGKPLGKDGYRFDFYQFENKRTAIPGSCSAYTDREKEYKENNLNTGIYKSLCPSVNDTYNNWGTFVSLRVRLSYSVVNSDGTEVNRVAYANYSIHLGYCEGNTEEDKARDFNCRRNTCYTYNVTVNGADKIYVEATSGDEQQPGAEGEIYDTSNNLISLDAHYCVYNVKFSNADRAALMYSTVTYFDNQAYTFTQDDAAKFGDNDYFNRQMVEWVQIAPTTDEYTVAKYPGEDNAWTLEDFRAVDGSGKKLVNLHSDDKQGRVDNKTERWYTIFFNEYAYKYNTDNSIMTNSHTGGEGGWEKWVNQNDRQLVLAIKNGKVSPDNESTYSESKYGFLQHSIQTYYSTDNLTATRTAGGMEQLNESFGLNFRWTWSNSMALSQVNGRWNVWQFANGKEWEDLISDKFASNPKVTEQFNFSTPNYYPAQIHNVRSLYGKSLSYHLETDPDPELVYYEMMDVCMNRNRDLDGDGKISANEMRWYLPSTGKYLRLVLGRNSMREPLMDYNATSELTYGTVWDANAKNSRFHFFTSDKAVLWAEEGLSKGNLVEGVNPTGQLRYVPWQARCIRNLGVDHTKVLDSDPVTPAYITEYETDENGNKIAKYIDMSYYDDASKRAPIAGKILPHKVNETANMVAPKLEFAQNAIWVVLGPPTGELKSYADVWADSLANNSPCDRYSQDGDGMGWRVPNQKELAIMRQAGRLGSGNYMSCSRTYFDDRFVGVAGDQSQAFETNTGSFNVWCVRDVIDNASRKSPSRNVVRDKAPNFRYVTHQGSNASLYSLPKRPTLLMFYDPDCGHCRDAVAALRNDAALSALVRDGKVNVIAVDAEEDYDYWKRTAKHLPAEWTVAFDRSGVIDNDLYPLEEIPMIYVLDADRSIVLSKAAPAEGVKTLTRIVKIK